MGLCLIFYGENQFFQLIKSSFFIKLTKFDFLKANLKTIVKT